MNVSVNPVVSYYIKSAASSNHGWEGWRSAVIIEDGLGAPQGVFGDEQLDYYSVGVILSALTVAGPDDSNLEIGDMLEGSCSGREESRNVLNFIQVFIRRVRLPTPEYGLDVLRLAEWGFSFPVALLTVFTSALLKFSVPFGWFGHLWAQSVNDYTFLWAELWSSSDSSVNLAPIKGLSGCEFCIHLLVKGIKLEEKSTLKWLQSVHLCPVIQNCSGWIYT